MRRAIQQLLLAGLLSTVGYASTVYTFSGTIQSAEGDLAVFNGGTISGTVSIDQVTETVEGTAASRFYTVNLGSANFSLVSNSFSLDLNYIPNELEYLDLQTEWSESLQSLGLTATQSFGFTATLNLYGGPNFLSSSVFPGPINWADFIGGNGTLSTSLVPTASNLIPTTGNLIFTVDSINEVPEPATTALLGGTLVALALARRRQSR